MNYKIQNKVLIGHILACLEFISETILIKQCNSCKQSSFEDRLMCKRGSGGFTNVKFLWNPDRLARNSRRKSYFRNGGIGLYSPHN